MRMLEAGETPRTSPLNAETLPQLGRHRAARAWMQLMPTEDTPRAIEVLKRRPGAVAYRIRPVGRASVIAKRCRASAARMEIALHERILPALPVSAPELIGHVPDADERFAWIFLEDAGEHLYCADDATHRDLLTRWMATLHASAALLSEGERLPDRDPAYFLLRLRRAGAMVDRHIAGGLLVEEHLSMLRRLRLCLDVVESCWPSVMDLCEGAPRTLVHGNLWRRNLRVRQGLEGLVLMPFDWELAGWGVPAIDLSRCPLTSLYGYLVRRRWPELTPERIHGLKEAGTLFRAIAATDAELERLGPLSVERPMRRLLSCYDRLDGVLTRMAAN